MLGALPPVWERSGRELWRGQVTDPRLQCWPVAEYWDPGCFFLQSQPFSLGGKSKGQPIFLNSGHRREATVNRIRNVIAVLKSRLGRSTIGETPTTCVRSCRVTTYHVAMFNRAPFHGEGIPLPHRQLDSLDLFFVASLSVPSRISLRHFWGGWV